LLSFLKGEVVGECSAENLVFGLFRLFIIIVERIF